MGACSAVLPRSCCGLLPSARGCAQVSKQLLLTPAQEAPMVEPFLRFGNTSSASTWCAARYPIPQHSCQAVLLLRLVRARSP